MDDDSSWLSDLDDGCGCAEVWESAESKRRSSTADDVASESSEQASERRQEQAEE